MDSNSTTFPQDPTDAQLADACMWQRHDFGLLSAEERRVQMETMRANWRAIWKSCNTPGRGGQYVPGMDESTEYPSQAMQRLMSAGR